MAVDPDSIVTILKPGPEMSDTGDFLVYETSSTRKLQGKAGIRVINRGGKIFISEVQSKLKRARKLKAGAELTTIDGKSTQGLGLRRVVDLLMGPVTSTATLSITLPSGEKRSVPLKREKFVLSGKSKTVR